MKDSSIKIHPLPQGSEPIKKEVGQLSVDIYQNETEIVLVAPIAGISKENLELQITDDVLVIRGERKQEDKVPEENYYTKECFWGPFSRSVVLPLEADSENTKASFDNNVLTVRIPKTEREQTKIIKIAA